MQNLKKQNAELWGKKLSLVPENELKNQAGWKNAEFTEKILK